MGRAEEVGEDFHGLQRQKLQVRLGLAGPARFQGLVAYTRCGDCNHNLGVGFEVLRK